MNSTVTCVTENSCFNDYLYAQQGQSLLIESKGKKFLFDVAQDFTALKHNLDLLNIDINSLDCIVISHKDFDHLGSLPGFIDLLNSSVPIYLPDDYDPKFKSKTEGNIEEEVWNEVERKLNVKYLSNGLRISDEIFLTKPIQADVKELSLVLDFAEKGIVVFSGCAHPGIESLVEQSIEITGNNKVRGIIGGLHLLLKTTEEVSQIVDYVKRLELEFIVPMHCTGYKAVARLYQEIPDILKLNLLGTFGVGNTINLNGGFELSIRGGMKIT